MRTTLLFLALGLAACSKPSAGTPAPSASAIATAAAPSADPSVEVVDKLPPPERPEPGPFTPPDDTQARDGDPNQKKQIGTPKDWVKAYVGFGAAETFWPPQLRLAKDAGIKSGKLAFERSGDVFVFDFASQTESQLTRKSQRNVAPRFFHDGKRIAFLSNRDGMAQRLFVMNVDGSDAHAVTPRLKETFAFAIAPDDKAIAYAAPSGEGNKMHVVDLESGRDDAIGDDKDRIEDLTFSPKGDELYYVRGSWDDEKVFAVDVASRMTRLVIAGMWWAAPQRMGDRVLVGQGSEMSYCCRSMRLVTMAKDGTDIKLLPYVESGQLYPKLSPHGTKIASGSSVREGGFGGDWRVEVMVMSADGSHQRGLTSRFPRPFYSAGSATWAPDDRHLALTLTLCPYMGCNPEIRSVVVVDTENESEAPAFIAYGGEPDFSLAE